MKRGTHEVPVVLLVTVNGHEMCKLSTGIEIYMVKYSTLHTPDTRHIDLAPP